MGLLDYFRSDPKLWRVGDHRVKKVRRTATDFHECHSYTRDVTKYKCVDCERIRKRRLDFLEDGMKCYEVIEE